MSYNDVIKAFAEAGNVATAEYWSCMMWKASVEARAISCSTVIKARLDTGDIAKAEHSLCMVLQAGVEAPIQSDTAL